MWPLTLYVLGKSKMEILKTWWMFSLVQTKSSAREGNDFFLVYNNPAQQKVRVIVEVGLMGVVLMLLLMGSTLGILLLLFLLLEYTLVLMILIIGWCVLFLGAIILSILDLY